MLKTECIPRVQVGKKSLPTLFKRAHLKGLINIRVLISECWLLKRGCNCIKDIGLYSTGCYSRFRSEQRFQTWKFTFACRAEHASFQIRWFTERSTVRWNIGARGCRSAPPPDARAPVPPRAPMAHLRAWPRVRVVACRRVGGTRAGALRRVHVVGP